MRKTDPVLTHGSFETLHIGKSVYAYKREYEGKAYIAIFNLCKKNAKIPSHVTYSGTIISNYKDTEGDILKPFEFRLLEV